MREGSEVATEHAKFLSLLKATQDEPIITGRTFNSDFMLAVTNHDDKYVNNFFPRDPERLFYWQRVMGCTQRFISAADAASFIDQLDKIKLKIIQSQNRSMLISIWDHTVRGWVESSFFPEECGSLLGIDSAIFGNKGRGGLSRQTGYREYLLVKNNFISKLYTEICKPSPARKGVVC